tara:strand:- start:238 stop:543 length:306 start_codon:yes stop_codon:yes gene_type:complete
MRNIGGRESSGMITISHKGKLLTTSVGATGYEKSHTGLRANSNRYNKVGTIPVGYDSRPDLITNLFFNTPTSWWLLCERNNYFDVFEQINVGDRIVIPKLS